MIIAAIIAVAATLLLCRSIRYASFLRHAACHTAASHDAANVLPDICRHYFDVADTPACFEFYRTLTRYFAGRFIQAQPWRAIFSRHAVTAVSCHALLSALLLRHYAARLLAFEAFAA